MTSALSADNIIQTLNKTLVGSHKITCRYRVPRDEETFVGDASKDEEKKKALVYIGGLPVKTKKVKNREKQISGLTLPLAIVAICY